MKKLLAGLLILWCAAASAQPVQQSGNVTPGHAACFAITGVIFDCGAPGGGVSVVGSTTTNDFVAFNASGSLIDSGINPANTSAISGLWNFNGGATAPTRPAGDNTTNVATTAFVTGVFGSPETVTGLWTFNGGAQFPVDAVPVSLATNPFLQSNSLTAILVNVTPTSATLPEFAFQSLVNSSVGSGNQHTAFKGAIFGSCATTAGSADCYGGNFVTQCASGTSTSAVCIALEPDINCSNGNYDTDISGVPAFYPYCSPLYIAAGGTGRSTAYQIFSMTGPTNRGILFFSGNATPVRLNVIEDYSTVTIGGLLKGSGIYPSYAIDLAPAQIGLAALHMPNNKPLGWVNAASNADIFPIVLNSSNILALGAGAAGVLVNTAAAGTIQFEVNGTNELDFGVTNGANWTFGAGANVFVGGVLSATSGVASTSTITGAFRVTGGIGVTGAGYFGAGINISGGVINSGGQLAQFGSTSGTPAHLATGQTTAPALTSCGTNPAITGTDTAGIVTMGTGAPTGCVITFNVAYSAAPYCVVTWIATPLASQSYVTAASTITLTQTGTSSNKVQYVCVAQSGG
jgi:hypothetical protein